MSASFSIFFRSVCSGVGCEAELCFYFVLDPGAFDVLFAFAFAGEDFAG
jgi:hypothetical protein